MRHEPWDKKIKSTSCRIKHTKILQKILKTYSAISHSVNNPWKKQHHDYVLCFRLSNFCSNRNCFLKKKLRLQEYLGHILTICLSWSIAYEFCFHPFLKNWAEMLQNSRKPPNIPKKFVALCLEEVEKLVYWFKKNKTTMTYRNRVIYTTRTLPRAHSCTFSCPKLCSCPACSLHDRSLFSFL